MLSSSRDSTMKIWDLREGRLLFTLQGHTGPVNATSFTDDGNYFASGGADQLVMVWKSNFFSVEAPEVDWGQSGEKAKTQPYISPGFQISSKKSLPSQKAMLSDFSTKKKTQHNKSVSPLKSRYSLITIYHYILQFFFIKSFNLPSFKK